ncbi:MAG TPA: hypothetical protein VH063_06980 [Gaiellaceae bacterium]|jgi:hypothetical protein|nr:hypothetical protein [Gaiellaceae bacterium]
MRPAAVSCLVLASILGSATISAAAGRAPQARLAKQVEAASRETWTFHPKNGGCPSYPGGKCPSFRLGRVTCEAGPGFSLCLLPYRETSNPYDDRIVWTTRIHVVAENGRWHRTKALAPVCTDRGVYEGCLVVLYT